MIGLCLHREGNRRCLYLFLKAPAILLKNNEHSEQAFAPHTNESRDVPPGGALSGFTTKLLHYRGGGFSRNRAQVLCIGALAQLLLAPAFNSRGTSSARQITVVR